MGLRAIHQQIRELGLGLGLSRLKCISQLRPELNYSGPQWSTKFRRS